ncbi:MAG: metallophosphoesterase [Actinomycetota bacterium]|nr:metallophosphoesterase [Actinomycetota bacterium]
MADLDTAGPDRTRSPSAKAGGSTRNILLVALTGMVGGLAGLGLVPSIAHELGPANVALHAAVGTSQTNVQVPPLGTVSALTHPSPLSVELSFRTVDFEELGPLATTPAGRDELRAQMNQDLEGVIRQSVVRLLAGGVVIGAVVAVLVWGRTWRSLAAGGAGAFVAVAALLGVTGMSYDIGAFEEPRYSGTLARAPVVIETIREQAGVLDQLGSRYDTATERLSDLLVLVAKPDVDPRTDTTAILHVGDIHANPLGVEIVEDLAEAFDVEAVIDSGDLGSNTLDTGSLSSLTGPIDRRLADVIDRIDAPYLYVRGNHDAPLLLRILTTVDNVRVLQNETTELGDLLVLGWADPTFTTDSSVTPEEKDEQRLAEASDVAASVELSRPDVLVVHDERLASGSYGLVPLILAGHTHSRALEYVEGTLVLTVGSSGATGLKSLTLETDKDYEAQVIYFREDEAVAVDYITFRGISNDFEVERTTLEPTQPSLD